MKTSNVQATTTGTYYTLVTAGASGSRISGSISVNGVGSTSEGLIRIYRNIGGGTRFLVAELYVPAITASTTDPAFHTSFADERLILDTGMTLEVALTVANTLDFTARYQDL